VVERVEQGSPAEKAGVKSADVLVRLAEHDVRNSLDMARALLDRNAGDQLPVVVRRKGEPQNLELVLRSVQRAVQPATDAVWRKLGLRLQTVSPDTVARNNTQLRGGLTVAEVSANGVADRSGIQRGDILVGLHIWETLTLDHVTFAVSHPDLATFNPITFYVIRGGQIRKGSLQIAD
jgi:serine protease Do